MPHLAMWYRRADYDRILAIMDDSEEFPNSFEEWEQTARHQVAAARSRGATIKEVFIEPERFVAFCKRKGFSKNGVARAEYAASIWRRQNGSRKRYQKVRISPRR
jgi:hypothetical protein